jgi:putative hydrolase of the HAD superfamily
LTDILGELIPGKFSSLIISERSKFRKPEAGFFNEAIAGFGVPASDIVYIGDSIRLDLEPGLKAGMNAWLIDRDNIFPACGRKISSFEFLSDCLS